MAGISHNAKNSNLPEFGDSVSAGSKALCGLTEAAAQVKIITECYYCCSLRTLGDTSSEKMGLTYKVYVCNKCPFNT